jgi:hypothetical protein
MTQFIKKSHRLLKDLQALHNHFNLLSKNKHFMASKSVMLTSTFAIAAVPAFLAQKRIAKWTLNHFPCKCMFSSA